MKHVGSFRIHNSPPIEKSGPLGCDPVSLGRLFTDVSKVRGAFVFTIKESKFEDEVLSQRLKLHTRRHGVTYQKP